MEFLKFSVAMYAMLLPIGWILYRIVYPMGR